MRPMRRQARAARAGRGAAAATVATFVALLSHVSAGGQVPGALGVLAPLALSFVACTALAGRRLSALRLGVAVALSQVLFHGLFVLGAYDPGAAGHVHGAVFAASGASLPVVSTDATMSAGHLFAAVATTVALHRAERTFALLRELADRCVAWVRARVALIAAALGPAPVRRSLAVDTVAVRPLVLMLVRSIGRRGPPVAAS